MTMPLRGDWDLPVCTLPTAERPLRLAEFDQLFATALWAQNRRSPVSLRWLLDPAVEANARELASRETACCSFFTFTFSHEQDAFAMDVTVSTSQIQVLDHLAVRATAQMRPR
jgi:hypothetical protein